MTRSALFLLLIAAAGCATDDNAAGTSNPGVATPAEVPAEMGHTPDAPPDTTGIPLE